MVGAAPVFQLVNGVQLFLIDSRIGHGDLISRRQSRGTISQNDLDHRILSQNYTSRKAP
jgi:hypothetical protein